MSEPLKSARPERQSIKPPMNQEEMIDLLAKRTAEEDDKKARQRYDEIVNPQRYYSTEKKRAMNIGVWLCLLVIIGIVVFAFSMHH